MTIIYSLVDRSPGIALLCLLTLGLLVLCIRLWMNPSLLSEPHSWPAAISGCSSNDSLDYTRHVNKNIQCFLTLRLRTLSLESTHSYFSHIPLAKASLKEKKHTKK